MPALASTENSIVLAPLFVLVFLWLGIAVGVRLLDLLGGTPHRSQVESTIVAAALGIGALQFVPFALGACGVLGRDSLRIAVITIVIVAARDMAGVASRGWADIKQ